MNQFAMFLVEQLKSGDLILLNGDFRAGKTTLTQFIGKALECKDIQLIPRHLTSLNHIGVKI